MAYLSLMDAAARMEPDGEVATIAELLSQANEFFQDMTWAESNLDTGHKSTVRTGLPQGTWRTAYAGVAYARSTTAQVIDGLGFLAAYSQIDKRVADLGGKTAQIRMTEDSAFLEGMSQQMATAYFYGNAGTTPSQFNGFSVRYNTLTAATAQNAQNVLNGGGTGSSNASLWLVGWGDMTNFGIYPKGTKAGLVFEDRGDIVPGYDSSANPFPAYTSYFEWNAGLVTKDWRYACRLANIDTTTNASGGLFGTGPVDLFLNMSKMVVRFPTLTKRASGITETDAPDEPAPGINPAFYCNRTVREALDIQAIRDRNVLLKPTEYAGQPVVEFRGVPIRVVDALLSTEATLT
jgi:hypothetical protein